LAIDRKKPYNRNAQYLAGRCTFDFARFEAKLKTVLTTEQIQEGVERLAARIREEYGQNPLTILAIMTGSVVLLADLIRRLDMPLRVGVMQASSYRGATTTRGELTINLEMTPDIRDRDVLLVDDIFDTGHTLEKTIAKLWELRPTSIRSAVLLRKLGRQEVAATPDYVAFEIPDEFVVGYGLDYRDEYRNLPYLAALEPADLST
jgi:hypoxanthine phosphoribosyltransferase